MLNAREDIAIKPIKEYLENDSSLILRIVGLVGNLTHETLDFIIMEI